MNNDLYIGLIKKTLIDYQKIGYTEYKPLYKNNDTWKLKFAIALDKLFRKNKLAICKFSQSTLEKDWKERITCKRRFYDWNETAG